MSTLDGRHRVPLPLIVTAAAGAAARDGQIPAASATVSTMRRVVMPRSLLRRVRCEDTRPSPANGSAPAGSPRDGQIRPRRNLPFGRFARASIARLPCRMAPDHDELTPALSEARKRRAHAARRPRAPRDRDLLAGRGTHPRVDRARDQGDGRGARRVRPARARHREAGRPLRGDHHARAAARRHRAPPEGRASRDRREDRRHGRSASSRRRSADRSGRSTTRATTCSGSSAR